MNDFERAALKTFTLAKAANGVLREATFDLSAQPRFEDALSKLQIALIEADALLHPRWYAGPAPAPLPAPTPELPPAPPVPAAMKLSGDQEAAWAKINVWLSNDKPWFVLKGFAGTGKTFLLQLLSSRSGVYLTAPTNKAAKVLSKTTGIPVRTTFSFLGLRLKQVEDKLVMEYGVDKPYLPKGTVLVVDEGSMTGEELVKFLEDLTNRGVKVMFVGDPAQLPPVGETTSPCWKITDDPECRAYLKQVVRYDNQLLKLATEVRTCIFSKDWNSPVENDNADGVGVFLHRESGFLKKIDSLKIEDYDESKIVAWRNKTVNKYNERVRSNFGFTEPYCVGDRLLLGGPIEDNKVIIAHTDEEFVVRKVATGEIFVIGQAEPIPIYSLSVEGDRTLLLSVPSDDSLDILLSNLSIKAKSSNGKDRSRAWKEFWETKNLFHSVRYGYAMTAHRAQGSTYSNVYVDQTDILANQDKREAFRCLYVALTRPTTSVHTF